MNDKKILEKDGFLVKKNFFSKKEIEKFIKISNKLHKNKNSKFGPIHNSKDAWDLIINDKIIILIKELLGDKNIKYLFHGHSVLQNEKSNVDNSWHRDNACRTFGLGPDWDKDYNILRVAIYLDKGQSGLNLIKKSHKSKGYLCKLINFLRKNYKYIYHKKIFRLIFDSVIGKKIITNPGDCIIFHASTYHSAVNNSKKSKHILRRAFFLTYGTDNFHSKNHMNYYFFHRKDNNFGFIKNNRKQLFKLLEEKKIKIKPPIKKIQIKFASI